MIARGERTYAALGTRRASRRDLQRRHQLLVVATGWSRRSSSWTLAALFVLDVLETGISLVGGDTDRAGAIAGSWRWLLKHRRRVRQRRRELRALRVLSDVELHRLQIGGAVRLRHFFVTLLREGLDRARGILPHEVDEERLHEPAEVGVGFAAAFAEDEEFDEIPESEQLELRTRPSRVMTSFRAQATVVVVAAVLWAIGSRNLVAMHLPLIGRLAPLDSWWSMWRHYFASWSANGVGTGTPGMPGFGVLGVAGTFVLGRMGILPRLALIFAVPVGAIGAGRLLKDRASNRARLVGALAYAAMPVGMNAIGQGRVDVLVVVAGLPFIVRRIFEVMDVPGFRTRPYSEPVPFGHRGWRTTQAGQRMLLIMLIALITAHGPSDAHSRGARHPRRRAVAPVRTRSDEHASAEPVAARLARIQRGDLPLADDHRHAARRDVRRSKCLDCPEGPWSVPSFSFLLRGADGNFGAAWWGWLLPLAAAFALVLCRGERRRVASKLAVIATLSLGTRDARVTTLARLLRPRPRCDARALRARARVTDRPRGRRAGARSARSGIRVATGRRGTLGRHAGGRESAVPPEPRLGPLRSAHLERG